MIDQARNDRNDRYLAASPDQIPPIHHTKHPASAMCLGIIASDGSNMPLMWFPKGGVEQEAYLKAMQEAILPWIKANYTNPGVPYIWQQDGPPEHMAKRTPKWLEENLKFWPSKMWPLASPDLAPLDYSIWGIIEARACATPDKNMDVLKASADQEWAAMSPDFIRKTCQRFRPHLEAMLAAKGGQVEK